MAAQKKPATHRHVWGAWREGSFEDGTTRTCEGCGGLQFRGERKVYGGRRAAVKKAAKKPAKKRFHYDLDTVLDWCERHDSHPTESWLAMLLTGDVTLDEMRAAVREDRSPKGEW